MMGGQEKKDQSSDRDPEKCSNHSSDQVSQGTLDDGKMHFWKGSQACSQKFSIMLVIQLGLSTDVHDFNFQMIKKDS